MVANPIHAACRPLRHNLWVSKSSELKRFRAALADGDSQVRLNAAVRLAYLGCADGVSELVAGLSHPEGAIRLVQVPEALALLGEPGLAAARTLVTTPGPARLGAAQTLVMGSEWTGVIEAIVATLDDPDPINRGTAMSLAGDIGPAAEDAFAAIAAHVAADPEMALALAAIDTSRAYPIIHAAADGDGAGPRAAAISALAGLGPLAVGSVDLVAAALNDPSRTLRERLSAGATLARISRDGDVAAQHIGGALRDADRWLKIGLLRALGQLGAGYPRLPERSWVWPLWSSRFALSAPTVSSSDSRTVRVIADYLDSDDYDLRRNAALALSFYRKNARPVADLVERAQIEDGLRHEVLRLVRGVAGKPHDDGALDMRNPAVDLDDIAPPCEQLWADATGGVLDYRIDVPKWQFLHYLVERKDVVLHGSRTADLTVLEPRSRSWGGSRTAGQPGLFAADHALMAMYFGIVDRPRTRYLRNGIDYKKRTFQLAVEFASLADRPFTDAVVYILPRETFARLGELTSVVQVKPLASLAVRPDDFPLLEYLWGADIGAPASQFGDRFPFLQDVALYPSKRSGRSAIST